MFAEIKAGKGAVSILINELKKHPDDGPEKEKSHLLVAFVSSSITLRITRILKGGS